MAGKRGRGSNSSAAVMGQRRGKDDNVGLSDEERLWKQLDFFPTPPWAARAGAEVLLDTFAQATDVVFEPACGQGHIVEPLREYFPCVEGSDVHDHGKGYAVRDWLDPEGWDLPECDWIVTNPPFLIAADFVRLGLQRAAGGVALLLRTAFIESAERYPLFEGGQVPLTQLCPFSERVPMCLGKWDPALSSATSYSWFIWSKFHDPMPPRWIRPGTRDRLWRDDDVRRFTTPGPMPLFEHTVAAFYEDVGDVI